MNTKNLSATARILAAALLLSVTTTAFAQGPTTPLGGGTRSSESNCPEYRAAMEKADALRAQARILNDLAKRDYEIAKSSKAAIDWNERMLKGAQGALQRAEASLAERRSEASKPENCKTQAWRDHFDKLISENEAAVAQRQAELKACEVKAEENGELAARAVQYGRQGDDRRVQAAKLLEEADALLRSASARCYDESARSDGPGDGDKKEKKEKKEKNHSHSHSLRNGLLGVGIAVGTHIALGGGRHERVTHSGRTDCDGGH